MNVLSYDDKFALMESKDRIGLTPKDAPMPQTVEEWQHLYSLAEQTMKRQDAAISKLKQKVNKLEQRLNNVNKG